jgi:hypothetical protein
MRGSTGTLYGHVLSVDKPSIILDGGWGLGGAAGAWMPQSE